MKQHFDMLWDPTGPTHPVEDQKYYQSYHQSDYLKMIDPQGDSQEEGTLVEVDSPEEESLAEVGDIWEEAHQEQDPLEGVGDPHQSKYCNHNQENW